MSISPTRMPSISPSLTPTEEMSMVPSSSPSSSPSVLPSSIPSDIPSSFPSSMPSKAPTPLPTPGPTPTPTPVPTHPSHYKVGVEYRGSSMATISTNDAASCETHCSSVGPILQGSVAWTFYTDGSNNCVCWKYFNNQAGTVYSNTDAVSGRFVDEGAPTTDNCDEKCRTGGTYILKASVDALDDCKAACERYVGGLGMLYQVSNTLCTCASQLTRGAAWDADYISVIY